MTSTADSIFDEDKVRILRLIHMNNSEGRDVLYHIYQWGTEEKDHHETLDIFLLNNVGYSNSILRLFDNEQKTHIRSNPSGSSFDITLLGKAIPLACKALRRPYPWVFNAKEDRLLSLITDIKNFRNFAAHRQPFAVDEQLFQEKTESLRDLLQEALNIATEVYEIDQVQRDKLIEDVNEKINKSRDDNIENWDITNYENSILLLERQELLLNEGKEELIKKYICFCHVSPVSFLTGYSLHVNVGIVFTLMEIAESGSTGTSNIEYVDILDYAQNEAIKYGSKTDVLLIEGIAGAGKTTLTKLILSQWQNQKSNMQHLLDYDLLIYFECRNTAIHSFTELLETLMPEVACKFRKGDLKKCILTLKLLVIADGLDELNTSSKQVLKEILDLSYLTVFTVLCTSRPEYVQSFYAMVPSGQHVSHIRIKGIPTNRRTEFVTTYHEELKMNGYSKQHTKGLINYLNQSSKQLEEHWRLPLNLVLLTIKWALSPDNINMITSATELYTEFTQLNKQLLVNKLTTHGKTLHLSHTDIGEKVDRFLLYLSWEALINLKDDVLDYIPDESVERLRDACSILDLPCEPVLSAFLVEGITYCTTKPISVFSFAHKSLQDYMAASYIIQALNGNDLRFDVTSIIKNIQRHPSFCNASLRQDFFCHIMSHLSSLFQQGTIMPLVTAQTESLQELATTLVQPRPATIQNVLEGLYGTGKVPSDLNRYQNTFAYTAGLLHLVPDTIRLKMADEVVHLFKQSGVLDKEQWFDFITEMKCHQSVIESIAKLVPNLVSGVVNISDTRVNVFSKLLKHGKPKIVKISIAHNTDESPDLETVMTDLSTKDTNQIDIYLHYNFRTSTELSPTLDDGLQEILKRGQIRRFMGRLSEGNSRLLPMVVERLWVAVDKGNACAMSEVFSALTEKGSRLEVLCVHVVPGVDPDTLHCLPGKGDLILYISDVDSTNITWASRVAQRLQPRSDSEQFNNIMLPRCHLNTQGFCDLLQELKSHQVRISRDVIFGGVTVASSDIPTTDTQELKKVTEDTLGCIFRMSDEEAIWPKITGGKSDAGKSLMPSR